MWRLGFLFHEITFGLLSVFLPLYIIRIGGTLLDIGIMTSVAMFAAITDPILVFERGLVSIEKSVEFTYKGVTIASKILEGFRVRVDLKMENLYAFFGGLTLFSLATSTLFTPLPVFFSQDLRFPLVWSSPYMFQIQQQTPSGIS